MHHGLFGLVLAVLGRGRVVRKLRVNAYVATFLVASAPVYLPGPCDLDLPTATTLVSGRVVIQ